MSDGDHADRPVGQARVALVCSDHARFGPLMRSFRRTIDCLEIIDSFAAVGDPADWSLVAVHHDDLSARDLRRIVEGFTAPGTPWPTARATGSGAPPQIERRPPTLLLLARELNHRDLATLFGAHVLTNLVCDGPTGPDLSDLLVTLRKLRGASPFGLHQYFTWGIEPAGLTLRRSAERGEAIAAIDDLAREHGVPDRLRALIRNVADEFLSNALYNAPIDPGGTRRFAHRPRTEPVSLEPGEGIEVAYCCDGRRFGLSTRDPFGSLTPGVIQDTLARAFRGGPDQIQQTAGAGLGFFQMFDSMSHVVANLSPGVATEMIGMIDVSGGYRRFVRAGKSFNIFATETSP